VFQLLVASRDAPIGPWACFEKKNPPYPVTSETSGFPYQILLSFQQLVSNHRLIKPPQPKKWGSGSKSTFGSPDRPMKISSEMHGLHATSVKSSVLHAFTDNSFPSTNPRRADIWNGNLKSEIVLATTARSECRASGKILILAAEPVVEIRDRVVVGHSPANEEFARVQQLQREKK
jgi:hypothetical protein